MLSGIGQGRFKPAQAFAVASQPIAVTAWEVTGDDQLDLVTENLNSSAVSVLPGKTGAMFGALEPLRSPIPIVVQMPARTEPATVMISDPAIAAPVQAAEMPSALFPVARVPAAGMPAPLDRIGMSFGAGSSDYGTVVGPNGQSYVPLVAMGRAGVKWIRLEGDASYFESGTQTYESMGRTVDDMIAHGYNVHVVVSNWQKVYPNDFPNQAFLTKFTQFAGALAAATNRPGHVVYEVWNEPNLLNSFWPKVAGVNAALQYAKMLMQTTEAIHTAHSSCRKIRLAPE